MSLKPAHCFVRVRPLTDDELRAQEPSCLTAEPEKRCIRVGQTDSYHFDGVFHAATTLQEICDTLVVGLVREVLKGYQEAVLLYGPTGGGKTHTLNQLLPVVVRLLLQVADLERLTYETTVTMECVELYMERVSDLFDPSKTDLQLREFPDTGVYVRGATEMPIRSPEELTQVWRKAELSRSRNATRLNATNTHRHCLVTLKIRRRRKLRNDYTLNEETFDSDEVPSSLVTTGRIYFADLAGCERLKDSGNDGVRQAETITINQSLSSLCSVMNALTDPKKTHVPFRDSKLTRLLQEPLGRDGRCYVLLCLPPSERYLPETRLALAFGVRAMSIMQQAVSRKQVDPTTHLVEVQHWLASRVHLLEAQVRRLTSSTFVECPRCIEKEIKLHDLSEEIKRQEAIIFHTKEEYDVSLFRLRSALETAQNDSEHYRKKSTKSAVSDEDAYEQKMRVLNEYWTGYAASLQEELEKTEQERDDACCELRILSDEIRHLRGIGHLIDSSHPNPGITEHNKNKDYNHTDVSTFIDNNGSIEKEPENLQEQLSTAEATAAELRTENKRLLHACSSLRTELCEAQQRAAELGDASVEVGELQTLCHNLRQGLDAAEQRGMQQRENLQEQLSTAEATAAELRTENKRLLHACSSLRTELCEAQQRAAELGVCDFLSRKPLKKGGNVSVFRGDCAQASLRNRKKHFCCWRSKLSSAIDELSGITQSEGSGVRIGLVSDDNLTVDVSNVVVPDAASVDSTAIVLMDIEAAL
ncbi:kinesin motor domain containing protein [Trypanosoma rangeli]|uniref:Kinesin motor domain containing protein n=1 Tax=Trypanosoma rangeli TaxID=5698 RepID=A0A422N3U0_TRYRA|nr:kinesin motor domain containing protein [Trypanosoma rangeli]RNF00114.1 kinesin motor domain containing protein [Trypanosoma rangeli]|eukprot:RNF00114.1 kinesin motor domain containing protein [Trypanosoma rangeli]